MVTDLFLSGWASWGESQGTLVPGKGPAPLPSCEGAFDPVKPYFCTFRKDHPGAQSGSWGTQVPLEPDPSLEAPRVRTISHQRSAVKNVLVPDPTM